MHEIGFIKLKTMVSSKNAFILKEPHETEANGFMHLFVGKPTLEVPVVVKILTFIKNGRRRCPMQSESSLLKSLGSFFVNFCSTVNARSSERGMTHSVE